jgi:hypothetical protein
MSSPQSASRRDFVKASAAAGVVATVSTAGAFAAGNDSIKVGLIGCGGRGTGAVRNILQAEQVITGNAGKVEITAVGDVFRDRAEGAVRTFKTGRAYRLPTEAEWEYAARAGKGDTAYFFGNDPAQLPEYAWFKDNSRDEENFPNKPKGCTHKVGTRKANPFGLHDLYGNVWEWTLDQYDPKTYERRAAIGLNLNPVTIPTADKWSHVVRGGSWADKADRCRSAARRSSDKSWMKWDPQEPQSIWWLTRMDVIGFRVVLAENDPPELVELAPKVIKKSE